MAQMFAWFEIQIWNIHAWLSHTDVCLIQAPDGESQPSTEVDLFISTEKIMVLNTDLKVRELFLGCIMNYGHFFVSQISVRIRKFIPDPNFSIPDPGMKIFRIRINEFKYF